MNKVAICLIVVCFLVSALAMPVSFGATTLSASQSIAMSGVIINTDFGFQMRGASVSIEAFTLGAINYQPNAWQLLKEANINTICVWGGINGDIAHFNINNYPNEWAQNLNNFLSAADQNGIKVYFGQLGNAYGTLFGIVSPGDTGSGPYSATPLAQAEAMIDRLAGINSLGHNFINDSRVVGWRTSNEVDISNSTVLNWNLQLCDYIRSKGGKVWLSSPYFAGANDFSLTEPLLQGHVDYLETHKYLIPQFISSGMNYATYYDVWNSILMSEEQSLGNFSPSEVILGEFGIWNGIGSDMGLTNVTFTDAERAVYYQAVFDAAAAAGIQNIMLFKFFAQKDSDGAVLAPNYGVVDANGSFYPYILNIIQNAYSSG